MRKTTTPILSPFQGCYSYTLVTGGSRPVCDLNALPGLYSVLGFYTPWLPIGRRQLVRGYIVPTVIILQKITGLAGTTFTSFYKKQTDEITSTKHRFTFSKTPHFTTLLGSPSLWEGKGVGLTQACRALDGGPPTKVAK